jgi:ubiquinone/menaquinone biosynthesis C-methylase UbiE
MTFDPRTEYQDLETAEQYDGKRFNSVSGRLFQWAERRVLQHITKRLSPGALVLDAPCGTGRLLPLYLSEGFRILGVDISGEMIQVARRRTAQWNGRTNFSRMDFVQIPLIDSSVDTVFSIRFLPHFSPPERVRMLREFCRVSRDRVVISLSVSNSWMRFRRKIKEWLGHDKPVRNPVTLESMHAELKQAGLREVERFWTVPVLSEQIIVVCEKN